MRPRQGFAVLAVALLVATSCSGPHRGSNRATAQLVAIGAGLNGPAGLHASVYTRGLAHAAAIAVDSNHRLWVATADYTDHGKDGVYLVSRPGATPVEVLTGLHTPLGLLWYRDALYVASKERVEVYGALVDRHFTKRRTILRLPAGSGESNNIVLGADGRILMGISAPCDHCSPSSKWSGTIVSFRPDGTDLHLYASGIRAPVGLAYFPGTNDLFVTMNQRDDLGTRTPPDWLAVVAEGTAWGFPGCYGQGGSVCRDVPQHTAVLDKHAAAAGIAIATGQLGPRIGTAALVAEWATGTVLRITLERSGSTYKSTVAPFLTGVERPVAVLLAPDGALLVGDWQTGAIYRISR
jgi:glucose/arabinose dehydrogenase